MAVDQLRPPRPSDRPDGTKLVEYGQYIDTQISRTRGMIKAVDVASALIVLAAGAIAFLLLAALAEHWLVPGGFGTSGRFALCGILMAGAGYIVYRRLAPLLLRPINPVFAAQTIEQSSPTLKNSLLNLLLFRQRRGELPPAVYATLEEQAAQRLARVPIDSAVDSTHLVRLGYLLVAIFTLAAVYIIFSPKSPLVAARRVLLPWADIPPASRVLIGDVQPGDVSVARGEVVDVSAEIRGLTDDEQVLLRYTTDDGQAVGKAVPMTPGKSLNRFEGRLPRADKAGGMVGIAGDARYWVEAGDARSREYAITVVTAPTIVVERVDYDFPNYTGYVDRSVDALGDLSAIEGTRVTIHARANGPIDEASIDFEADGRRDIPMQVDGTQAQATFTLALRDDRTTPRHASYVVRFTNSEGRQNNNPVQYPIEVSPDVAPEVELLAPQEKVLHVRVDETVPIEVEAIDPDFGLGGVRLRGEAVGRPEIVLPLLAEDHTGKFEGRLQFTPSEHGLRVGDELRYWAEAADNRLPEPNVATSERQTIRITSPDPNRAPQPDPAADPQNQQPGQNGQPQDQPADGEQGEQQQGEGGSAAGDQQEGQPAENQQGQGQGAEGQASQDRGGEESKAQDQPGGAGGIGRESDGSQQRGEGGQQKGQPREPGEQSDSNEAGDSGGTDGQLPSTPGEKRPGNQQQPGNEQQPGEEGQPGDRQPNGEPNAEQSPVSPDGDNDGEAFERIGEFMRDRGQVPEEAGGEDAPARSEPSKSQNSPDNSFNRDAKRSGSQDQPGPSKDSSGAGPGAETRPGEAEEQANEQQEGQPGGERDESESPGGEQTSTKGPSGAGEQPGKDQGAPDSQPGMKPANKREQQPSGESQTDDQEPPAGGKGKRESDSQGDQGGDRAGGGEEGGGQQAPREGTGSAGQNQSADEGAGQSTEQGAGRDSNSGGQDAQAEGKTGESSGDKPGEGSNEREGQGKERGGKAGDTEEREGDGQPGGEDAPARSEQSKSKEDADSPFSRDAERSAPGAPTGAGKPGEGVMEPAPVDGVAPGADAANLEYARNQTDLVLEKLAHQLKRNEVDQELLDQLGWTEEELRRFVERWQSLKAAAGHDEPAADAARRELDESLRSLGLRRGPLQQNQQQADKLRDLREGYRGPVPLEYRDRLRAYNEGVSRSRQEDE